LTHLKPRPRRALGRSFLAALALAGWPSAPARAGQQAAPAPGDPPAAESSLVLFPTVIVAATGYREDPFRMPFSTSVLTAEWLEQRRPRTTPAAFEELPGIMVQKSSAAQASPYIRGFTGFRTLMLIDGIRLNNSVFREGPTQYWGTIDPFSIARMEVIKGPSSVIYGSDAVGGTVNAVSAGRVMADARSAAGGRAIYRFASADNSSTGRLEAAGQRQDRWGAHIGISLKDYGDLRAGRGSGMQPHSGYTEHACDGRLDYRLGDHLHATALLQSVGQDDAWRTHSTVHGSTWEGTRPGSDLQRSLDQRRRLLAVQLHAATLAGAVDEVHASVSGHRQEEDQFRLRGDRRREDSGFAVNTLGAFLQLQSRSPVGRWIYGAEFYRDWVDSHSVRYRADGTLAQVDIQGPVAGRATYDLAGGYIENRLPRLGPLDLILGGRYNYAAASARRVRDPVTGTATGLADDWRSLVGSLRGVVRLDRADRSNLFVGVSEAFRAPNLSDLTRFDLAEGGQIETPAPGLEPEYFLTREIGWRTRRSPWSAEAAYFHTTIRNQIIRTPTGATVDSLAEVTKRNSGSGYVHGIELAAALTWPRAWTLRGNLTWQKGELDHFPSADSAVLVRAPLSRVMPVTAHLALRWEPRPARLWLELAGSAAARQDRLAPADKVDTERIPAGGTPGYRVVKLRGGWHPTAALLFTAAIENLTDANYRIHGSGLNEPGRGFVVSAESRF
jgi:hemoglobin/transferrin/lactoferrin receptor protein